MLFMSVCLSHPGGSASSSGLAPPGLVWLWRCPHDPYHCRVETLWICPPASDVCCASALSTLCLQPSTATAGLQTENGNWLILCCCFQVASTWQEPTPTKTDIDQFLTLADIMAVSCISFIFCCHHDVPGCHPSLCLQAKSFHATAENIQQFGNNQPWRVRRRGSQRVLCLFAFCNKWIYSMLLHGLLKCILFQS